MKLVVVCSRHLKKRLRITNQNIHETLGLYLDWLPGKRYHPWSPCGKPLHSHPGTTQMPDSSNLPAPLSIKTQAKKIEHFI